MLIVSIFSRHFFLSLMALEETGGEKKKICNFYPPRGKARNEKVLPTNFLWGLENFLFDFGGATPAPHIWLSPQTLNYDGN